MSAKLSRTGNRERCLRATGPFAGRVARRTDTEYMRRGDRIEHRTVCPAGIEDGLADAVGYCHIDLKAIDSAGDPVAARVIVSKIGQ